MVVQHLEFVSTVSPMVTPASSKETLDHTWRVRWVEEDQGGHLRSDNMLVSVAVWRIGPSTCCHSNPLASWFFRFLCICQFLFLFGATGKCRVPDAGQRFGLASSS